MIHPIGTVKSGGDSRAFLDRYRHAIRSGHITVGCSFSPEHCESLGNIGASPLDVLRIAVEDYGISDIRLGLRWSTLAPDNEAFSDYYDPYIDFCLNSAHVRRVLFDIGPIKTFRWPEVHVPEIVLSRLSPPPPTGSAIGPTDPIATQSYAHAGRALDYLAQRVERSNEQTRVGFAFNEPFHSFGPRGWTVNEDYLSELVTLIQHAGFGSAEFLLTSSEGLQLGRIASFFERLLAADPTLAGRLTSGYDLYPFAPTSRVTGAIRTVRRLFPALTGQWRSASRSIAQAQALGYDIEVTEAQAEPWNPAPDVGDSLRHFERVLGESITYVLNPQQPASVIRMWGIEHQITRRLGGSGGQNAAILDLTREINAIGSEPIDLGGMR